LAGISDEFMLVEAEMSGGAGKIALLVAGLLATAVAAFAQEPAASFEALAGRVRIGQLIWVTDPTGREVRGRLERLSSDELVLQESHHLTLAAPDVRRVRARDRDSLKNGALIGLGIGGAMGAVWCIGAVADDSGDVDARVECAEGFTVFPGLGALIGLAVDAVIPGKMRVIYQSSASQEAPRAQLMVAPLVSSRVKGLAILFAF
jgi:hypothetical protein